MEFRIIMHVRRLAKWKLCICNTLMWRYPNAEICINISRQKSTGKQTDNSEQ